MKTLLNRIIAATFVLAAYAQAVNTTPCGYITVIAPAGSLASPSYTTLSIPLYNAAAFIGSVATVDSATQVTITGAAWTAGQYAATSAPYLARVTTGVNTGRFFLITANTTNQLTVSLVQTPSITTLVGTLTAGDMIAIVPANTIGSIFGTTATNGALDNGIVTNSSPSLADNLYILNAPGQGWGTYYHNGTNWKKSGAISNQNNAVCYPDEGIVIVHTGASPVNLKLYGTVPSTGEKTDISGTGSTFAAVRFPVDAQLNGMGFQSIPGWVAGASADTADNVWAWSTTLNQWEQFYFNGNLPNGNLPLGNWKKSGSLGNQNGRVLPAGSSVIVIRNATSSTQTLSQTLPYTP